MDQHTKKLNAYQTAQKDLGNEFPGSDGYSVDYYTHGKMHTVKVYKSGLSGEGTTKDDFQGAFKALYNKVTSAKLPSGSSYRQEVHNYLAKDKGFIKEEVNGRGKATVTVVYLLVEKSSETSIGPVHYDALCALRALRESNKLK